MNVIQCSRSKKKKSMWAKNMWAQVPCLRWGDKPSRPPPQTRALSSDDTPYGRAQEGLHRPRPSDAGGPVAIAIAETHRNHPPPHKYTIHVAAFWPQFSAHPWPGPTRTRWPLPGPIRHSHGPQRQRDALLKRVDEMGLRARNGPY